MKPRTQDTLKDLFSLEGRRGIVTGASSGLGLAVAQVLADAGATVYAFNRTVRSEVEYDGVTQIHVDITDSAAVDRAIEGIGSQGGLDFIVNNAGITQRRRAEDVEPALWDSIVETNVNSLFRLCQSAYPYLKVSRHMGRIVNIASMAGHMGFTEVTPYCCTKSAVGGITRGLATEWREDNILVNSISPGWFPSAMSRQVMDEGRKQKILGKIALGKFGEPQQIGHMALFLISDAATYITGQDYAVDGGATTFGF